MKRSGILLLAGGVIAGVFLITGYSTAGSEVSAGRVLMTSQEAGFGNQALFGDPKDVGGHEFEEVAQEGKTEPQLEPFDRACEESLREYYLRLAKETEPQLEPFDRACEESFREYYLRLAKERVMDREFTLVK